MFYPSDSLKRGGRFYLCWVADAWPLRFATITHRQLWSQDIRRICDDLMEVVSNESGNPSNRFSLRLSSQLMRGLIRLYQRKVTIFLDDLCMMNANVAKHVNKKLLYHEAVVAAPGARLEPPLLITIEPPENEERVEERIQESGNMVANIQDITLKEPALPEQALLNDNFGETHPDQPFQLLADKTLEVMLGADASATHASLEVPLEVSDRSHDRSRLAPRDAFMERISEHDRTLFGKSIEDEQLINKTIGDIGIDKEIAAVPDISETLPPELPVRPPEMQIPEEMEVQTEPKGMPAEQSGPQEPEVFVLEELEEEPVVIRRRPRKLIVDKHTILSSNYMRSRLANVAVDVRSEHSVVSTRVPAEALLSRAAHAGWRARPALGASLSALFARNCGPVRKPPLADREMEGAVALRVGRSLMRTALETIDELPERTRLELDQSMAGPAMPAVEEMVTITIADKDVTAADSLPGLTVEEVPPGCEDISDLPTQVIPTLSQEKLQSKKRPSKSGQEATSPKVARKYGYASQRMSQPDQIPMEAEKENVTDNKPGEARRQSQLEALTSLLHDAGLADLPRDSGQPRDPAQPLQASQRDRNTRAESETPLGSLDRTKVSLGDSDITTESKRLIREQWGTEGTMIKIIYALRSRTGPVSVRAVLARGPAAAAGRAVAAARCFTSILKLKQHGFINLQKDPTTLEIQDITFGPKFHLIDSSSSMDESS